MLDSIELADGILTKTIYIGQVVMSFIQRKCDDSHVK
jgi:hypothetical protein